MLESINEANSKNEVIRGLLAVRESCFFSRASLFRVNFEVASR